MQLHKRKLVMRRSSPLYIGTVRDVIEHACIKLHKGITIISKEQGILDKRMEKLQMVIDEMENGNIPNAAMKKI